MRFDDSFREMNFEAETSDTFPEFVIVGEEIENRFEASNASEIGAAEGQRRAEGETNSALELPCDQHARDEVGADAERFELRRDGRLGNSPIEAGDHAYALVSERRGHAGEIIRFDADIAVVHDKKFMARVRQHLLQVADLHIRA